MAAVNKTTGYVGEHERDILVLYATETGNALDIAEQIVREARRRLFSVRLTSADAYPLEELIHETHVIFVVSTTGSGVEPRSMTAMWNMLLRSDLPADIFEDLYFTVFGLGDSAYEKFCWAAKKLSRRLISLGAQEICGRGEGDEQHPLGIEGALDAWIPNAFAALEHLLPPPPDTKFENPGALSPPRIIISTFSGSPSIARKDPLEEARDYHLATIRCNDRITAADWFQDVRHIELDLEDDVLYDPGDVAVIHPIQPTSDVDSFLDSMNWQDSADNAISIAASDQYWKLHTSIPRVTTLRQLFTRYLDINAVPRRSFFKILRHFTNDELESEKLAEFCTPEGADELYQYVTRVRRTIREVLAEFRSVRLPKEYIFDLFPLLRPRQFSIASSSRAHRKQVHLCVAIVRYRTKLKIPRRGVCSTYLNALNPGDTMRISIQHGFLSLPKNLETPVVCIGPGTGVAPMRALLEQRIFEGARDNILYFGCRSASKDHHYGSEWLKLADSHMLTYRPAFSRDGPEGVKRRYVQDCMFEDAKMLWDVVGRRHGWVYISGSSNKMPVAVKETIASAAREAGGMLDHEARSFVKMIQENGRLYEECWS